MNSNMLMKGRFKIKTYQDGILKRESDWIENLIMAGVDNGIGVAIKRMIGDFTYDMEIDTAEIGDGDTAPAVSDTSLENAILTGISRANQSSTATVATFEFFIASDDLANGDYKEFGLRAGTQLFARALIVPVYTKSSNEDTSIEYQITLANQ